VSGGSIYPLHTPEIGFRSPSSLAAGYWSCGGVGKVGGDNLRMGIACPRCCCRRPAPKGPTSPAPGDRSARGLAIWLTACRPLLTGDELSRLSANDRSIWRASLNKLQSLLLFATLHKSGDEVRQENAPFRRRRVVRLDKVVLEREQFTIPGEETDRPPHYLAV